MYPYDFYKYVGIKRFETIVDLGQMCQGKTRENLSIDTSRNILYPLDTMQHQSVEQPEEINPLHIKNSLGKRVEVLAFGLCYAGKLTKIDLKEGTIRIEDEKDYVILEIERIEAFKTLGH